MTGTRRTLAARVKPYSEKCAGAVSLWEDDYDVPFPLVVTFYDAACSGSEATFSVAQARKLISDLEAACKVVAKLRRKRKSP